MKWGDLGCVNCGHEVGHAFWCPQHDHRTDPLNLCGTCGGTILPPTRTGVPRGTCHCPRNLSPERPR